MYMAQEGHTKLVQRVSAPIDQDFNTSLALMVQKFRTLLFTRIKLPVTWEGREAVT